jgi:hypothetical protein
MRRVMSLLRSDLIALARKYRALAELRRAEHHVLDEDDVRVPLQQLAHEFPGALRELDSLPLDEIDRRIDELEEAASRGAVEPWMEWMHHYHVTMRAALHVKRQLAGRRNVSDRVALDIVRAVSRESGYRCDLEFVRAVARPPEGRINVLVFLRLAELFGAEPRVLWLALFPERGATHH